MNLKLYTCIAFVDDKKTGKQRPCKYRNVTNVDGLKRWLEKYGFTVNHINVYDKQTKQFIEQKKYENG